MTTTNTRPATGLRQQAGYVAVRVDAGRISHADLMAAADGDGDPLAIRTSWASFTPGQVQWVYQGAANQIARETATPAPFPGLPNSVVLVYVLPADGTNRTMLLDTVDDAMTAAKDMVAAGTGAPRSIDADGVLVLTSDDLAKRLGFRPIATKLFVNRMSFH